MNTLYYGDNLDILRRYIKDEAVDLVYLDRPFKSNQDYNVLFAEQNGTRAASQIKAFEDTWEWDEGALAAYEEIIERGPERLSNVMQAFRTFLGDTDMLAYLAMMAPRLLELHRVLKATGSIYLHCDSTASAHLRLLMDATFGPANFRNEIIWYYYNKLHDRRKKLFPRATDTILFYVKDVRADFTYRQLKEDRDQPIRQLLRKKFKGRMVNVKDADGHVVYQVKTDKTTDNVWRIPCLQPAATERLGYPTQKPEALLERIITASSSESDLVLDPFCGCGTTIAVAERLKRRWIGIDITPLAITLIRHRLKDAFGDQVKYEVIGEPVSLPDARGLAEQDRLHFQAWALGLVGARPVEQKKGADQGIDGRFYFHDEPRGGRTKQVLFSVKSGHVSVKDVRELIGVVQREKAEMGVLITLEPATQPMKRDALSTGHYTSRWGKHRRTQILTIEDLLGGKGIDYPAAAQRTNVTFKRAPMAALPKVAEPRLPLGGGEEE